MQLPFTIAHMAICIASKAQNIAFMMMLHRR